ncbi:hypothetical protein SDC9_115779 [bioreactor metagenome]|uniref:Uncharacterized protein n=1 Tax=bioreactor metagenome TaxID=1076179 RepID=A0A645C4G3_9ZZZZ
MGDEAGGVHVLGRKVAVVGRFEHVEDLCEDLGHREGLRQVAGGEGKRIHEMQSDRHRVLVAEWQVTLFAGHRHRALCELVFVGEQVRDLGLQRVRGDRPGLRALDGEDQVIGQRDDEGLRKGGLPGSLSGVHDHACQSDILR